MSTATVQALEAMNGTELSDFTAWYDAKTEEVQELIDSISDMTSNIIEESEYDSFIEELDSYGIENASTFEDAYAGCYEGSGLTSAEAEFCQELCSDCGYIEVNDLPSFLANHIDWQAVWDCELRHDYFTIEAGSTYFFSAHF